MSKMYFWDKGQGSISHVSLYGTVIPIPAALPLFAGALALLGLLGWRKQRTVAA